MSLYTTSLEVIVNNLCDDKTKPLKERIESARPKIFDFSYSLPEGQPWTNDFKKYFETAFINQYLFDEIAQETFGRFKQRLENRIFVVLPKYQLLFKMLSEIDYDKLLIDNFSNHSVDEINSSAATSTTGSKSAGSQLPENMLAKGEIGDFVNVGYANDAEIALTENETKGDNERHIVDKTETRNNNQLIVFNQISNDFNNCFEEFLNEFKILFSYLLY